MTRGMTRKVVARDDHPWRDAGGTPKGDDRANETIKHTKVTRVTKLSKITTGAWATNGNPTKVISGIQHPRLKPRGSGITIRGRRP